MVNLGRPDLPPDRVVFESVLVTPDGERYSVGEPGAGEDHARIQLWGENAVYIPDWDWQRWVVHGSVLFGGFPREWMDTPILQRARSAFDVYIDKAPVNVVLGVRPHLQLSEDVHGWACYIAQEGLTLEAMAFESELGLEPCLPMLSESHVGVHEAQHCVACLLGGLSCTGGLSCSRCRVPFPCDWARWLASFPADYPTTPPPPPR